MFGYVFHDTNGHNHYRKDEDPVELLEQNSYGHLLPGLLWKYNSSKLYQNLDGRKFQIGNVCMFVHRKQGLFLSVHVDDIQMAGKKQNLAPMWKHLMKNVDIDEPTSFLDHVYLGCTQGECKPTETVIEQFQTCSNHVFLLEQQRNYRDCKNLKHKQWRGWSPDMEGHAQKCV